MDCMWWKFYLTMQNNLFGCGAGSEQLCVQTVNVTALQSPLLPAGSPSTHPVINLYVTLTDPYSGNC